MSTTNFGYERNSLQVLGKRLILALLACCGCISQTHIASPNWSEPHYNVSGGIDPDLVLKNLGSANCIQFSFVLSASQRTTSAAVYDAAGTKVRTLWMNRAFNKGEYHEIWDGKNDSGDKAPSGLYTVKLGYNNVIYTWDGIIGNTEASWSYQNWDAVVPSFIRSLAFLDGKAFAASGYNEGGYAAAVFDEARPNSEVRPLTKYIFNTLLHFMFTATDGRLLYFGFQTYGERPQPSQGVIAFYPSGEYYRFPNGAPYPSFPRATGTFWNNSVTPPIGLTDVQAIDVSPYPTAAVTGLAVQRSGAILATAHGFYQPGGEKPKAVPSSNQVRLWDKTTGGPKGSFTIPDPQVMTFDLQNDLWVISGNGTQNQLYRVRDVGSANLVDSPILGLSNPVSVSVSPRTGSLFVADGGTSQQVKEFDIKTNRLLSTIGNPGGYISNKVCNSTVSDTTFWFDPGPNMHRMPVVGTNSPFVSWVSVSETGDLWVGDFSTSRILHFAKTAGAWKYVDRIMYMPWSYNSSVPFADPTRIFGGPSGFLEFKVDYSVPLTPGDPDEHAGRRSWELVRNWLPCFVKQDPASDLATEMSAYSFPNGKVVGAVFSNESGNIHTLLGLDDTGLLKVKHIAPLSSWVAFDQSGSYYDLRTQMINSQSTVSFRRYGVSGYDTDGFPLWYPVGQPIGSYVPNHSKGEVFPRTQRLTAWPSAHAIIPVFETERNVDISPGVPAFHLGGLPVGGHQLKWMTMPEKLTPFTDGDGSFPISNSRKVGQVGVNAWAVDDNIFAFQNGNGSTWSCQFYHFKDDGLFVGQFGFQTSSDYPTKNVAWPMTGFPQKGTEQPLAPGECTDESHVNSVRVRNDYYIYLGDESYHKGVHRWHVQNLDSYGELSGSVRLGGLLVLHK